MAAGSTATPVMKGKPVKTGTTQSPSRKPTARTSRSQRAHRWLAGGVLAVLALAAIAGAMLVQAPPPAEAQTTPRILVSNVSQEDDVASDSPLGRAQLFQTAANTGTNTGGWTLTSVIVVSEDDDGDAFDVEICEVDSSKFPTSTCTGLTAPAGFTAGNLEFTHTGLVLSADTDYVVVIKPRGTASVAIDATSSAGEDPAGLTGWSIKDNSYRNNGVWADQSGEVLQITVNGHETEVTEVWSATLTVGEWEASLSAILQGWDDDDNYTGAVLTSKDFTTGGDTYVIRTIQLEKRYQNAILTLRFSGGDIATETTRDKLTLHVGSDSFDFGAGIYNNNYLTWTETGLNWLDGDSVDLRITVTNLNEPPDAPDAPTVTATAGSITSLDVMWTAPSNVGKPAIDHYDLRYLVSGSFTDGPQDQTRTTVSIGDLDAGTPYEVQVRAHNSAGDGPWSASGMGRTISAPVPIVTTGTEIWTSTIFIGEVKSGTSVFNLGYSRHGADEYGYLSDDDFDLLGTTYTVELLTIDVIPDYHVVIRFDQAPGAVLAAGLTLHLGTGTTPATESFDLDTAVAVTTDGTHFNLGTHNLHWSHGTPRSVALTYDPPPPNVSSIALTSAPGSDDTYAISDVVEATVTFSVAVDITGTPQLELDFAGTAKAATCTAATNTTTMVCTYTVAVNDVAAGGVAIAANKLTGGTITATGSTTDTAVLDHTAVMIDAKHKVDGIRPTLVTTGSNAPKTSTDGTKVILTFSEDISAVDRAKITIMSGTETLSTSMASMSGTAVEITLTTALTYAAANLTVALSPDAVDDTAGNGILDVAATTVTNAVVNQAPSFPPTEDGQRTVPENTPVSADIGAPVAAEDPENDGLTYSLSGTDAASFEIDSGTGQLRVASGVALDFEGQRTYHVTVEVNDGKDQNGDDELGVTDARQDVTVTVTNVNEAPEITTISTTYTAFDVDENTATSAVIKTYEATDVDADTTMTWSLEGNDAGDLTITKNADGHGELKFANVPNFEMPVDTDTMNDYDIRVKVKDNGTPDNRGASNQLDDTVSAVVSVADVNEAPEITTAATTANVDENSTAVLTLAASDVDASDTLRWSVEPADDWGKFDINANSGALSFKNAPDFETPTDVGAGAMNNTYVVTVKVADAGSLSDTHKVTVTVTNVNEAPEITTTSTTYTDFDVDENTATSEVIKTYEATDVDASTTLTWSLEGNDAGDFTITKNAQGQGELKFRNAPNFEMPVDADTMNDYDIRVKVRDDGIPGNRGSSNRLDDTVSVVVNVLDVNEAPVVSGDPGPSFPEIEYDVLDADLTAANYIIATYSATDDDNSDNADLQTITWDVSGDDAAHFTINSTTGVLSFSIRPDFENAVDMGSGNTYEIVVEADDGQGESNSVGTFPVTVTVTNVDETPEITTTAASHTAPSFMEIEYDATTADLTVADYDGRDEEGQTITWTRTGTDAGDFTIDTSTGVLRFAQRPNFEMPADYGGDNAYNIIVRASDTASPANVRELAVVVTVTDVNERPDINEDTVSSYAEIEYDFTGTRPDVHTFTATDYDDMDTFAWSLLGTDAAHLEIGAASGVLTFRQDSGPGQDPLPNFEGPRDDDASDGSSNTYSITVQATDDDAADQKFTDYAVVVTVTDVNEAPEFTGTPDTAPTPDEHDANDDYVVMDLADYDARDEESGVTWSLTGTDRGDFAISADGVVTFAATPNYEDPEDSGGDNVYEFTVVATDVASGSSRRNVSIDVTVTVGDVEEAGTVTVDKLSPAVGEPLTFRLTDPDGGIDLTLDSNMDSQISWGIESMATGGSWAAVGGVFSPNSTTFTYTVDEDDTGKALRGVVTYIDRRGPAKTAASEATAEVTADPIANVPPRFRGGSTWSVEEGPAGRNVGVPISATDRDNDVLTYGIQPSQNSGLFEINPSTGQVRTVEALDFETTSGRLLFVVTLHDGRGVDDGGTTDTADDTVVDDGSIDDTRTISVFVVDVEEDGVVTLSAAEAETGTPLTATLEDGDGGVTGEIWQWARSENGRTGWTNISGATSSSYTPTVADEDFFLRATVTYTDRRGAGKSAEGITGRRVPSENRSPMFPSTEDGQRTVPENTRAGGNIGAPVAAEDPENDSLTYTLTGSDAGAFTIVDSTGQIRVKDDLDFETKSRYSLTVEVHDGRDGMGNTSATIDDTRAVTITVENVEEPGVVTLTTDTGTIQARAEATAALEDDDGPSGIGWQWARSPNGRTDWVNIAGATSATYTPTLEEDRGNYIRAIASYGDGHGPNKTAEKVSPRVGDPPPVNAAPVFPPTENGQREVEENSPDGTAVGAPVAATDLNAGDSAVNDPLVYSLTGTDAASFTIDGSTGQLRVASGVELDFEGKRTYRATVEVTDGRDQNGDDDMDAIDDRQNVAITVTNVNEAPVVTGDDDPSFQEHSSAAIATYAGADPERDTLTWSVSVDDFWISSRGRLYFRTPPSFEGQTTYQVTVTATDDDETANLSGTLAVTVTVTDAEEEGVVAITPTRGWVDVPTVFTADLADDDGGVTGTTWQWERSPNGRSGWADIPNATSGSYTVTAGDANQYLRASASYEDRRGSNKTASAALTAPVGDARPATNTAPEFTETAPVTRTVQEGTAAGRSVGASVRATDADQGDVLTYSLSGTDAELFDIDPATGQIRTKAIIDRAVNETYAVTVSVHDGFDGAYIPSDAPDATIEVTITVTAVPVARPPRPRPPSNQPPVFVDGPRTDRPIAENTAAGENVGPPVVATDSGILTFTLGGADAGFFAIVAATGQIQVGDGTILDHEAEKNTYVVEVAATDSSGATARITVTVIVTNLDEPGTVTLSPVRPSVDTPMSAALTDPDGDVSDVTWRWARDEMMDGTFDDVISGATGTSYTPVDADAGMYLKATAGYTDGHGTGKSTSAATASAVTAGDPLVARYDANGNGMIDKAEVIAAINDYLFGEGDEAISKAEVIRLIDLYLFGGGGGGGGAVTDGDPLVARYDANNNGMIDKAEVIAAINDYLFGEGDEAISKAEVIRLINLYLFG